MEMIKCFRWQSNLLPAILIIFLVNTVQAEMLPQTEDTVRIGLMLSEDPVIDINSREALFTVQYVADKVNEEGGLGGRKLEIIYKSSDGDWGISSKRSVELIFDHEVSAIMGSLDGQNAHLTQMAITRSEVVFLATRSTDPTLSSANIPWFFRVIPSDKQQAEKLVQFIFQERGLNNIAVIYSNRYDSRMAADTFNRLASEMHHYTIRTFEFEPQGLEFGELLTKLKNDKTEGIVHYGSDNDLNLFLSGLNESDFNKPVFLPLTVQSRLIETEFSDQVYSVCPQNWPLEFDSTFIDHFNQQFQRDPGLIAAYSYDGIQTLIDRIKNNGSGRREIRDQLLINNSTRGVTGQIRFNSNGDVIDHSAICKR